jgi:hypothetical protein
MLPIYTMRGDYPGIQVQKHIATDPNDQNRAAFYIFVDPPISNVLRTAINNLSLTIIKNLLVFCSILAFPVILLF